MLWRSNPPTAANNAGSQPPQPTPDSYDGRRLSLRSRRRGAICSCSSTRRGRVRGRADDGILHQLADGRVGAGAVAVVGRGERRFQIGNLAPVNLRGPAYLNVSPPVRGANVYPARLRVIEGGRHEPFAPPISAPHL